MCGRFGSTLTVCAWPTWLVRPISFGLRRVGDVDDLEAALRARRERRACPGRGSGPAASVASRTSCVSPGAVYGFG